MSTPGTDMLTPAGEEPGVIVENEDHLRGEEYDGQNNSNTSAR